MPIFNGDNPDGWVFRAHRYFHMNQFSSWEKVEAVVVYFERETLAWCQWKDSRQPMRSWEDLKVQLLERFRPPQEGTILATIVAPKVELWKLRQCRRGVIPGVCLSGVGERV